MAAAAAVTSPDPAGTLVVNVAFRPLGALVQEVAAVDIISEGGLTSAWARGTRTPEVRSLGLPFPPAGERVREVARTLDMLPRLFAGETVDRGRSGWSGLPGSQTSCSRSRSSE